MTLRAPRGVLPTLATVGGLGVVLALPAAWPGFTAWQPKTDTLTPADTAGQDLVLEYDHPLLLELSAASLDPQDADPPDLTAQVTILSPTPVVYEGLPVRIDPRTSRARIRLDSVAAGAGAHLLIVLRDPEGQAWIWATEHDSYPAGSRVVGGGPVGGDLAFRITYQRRIVDLLAAGWQVALQSMGLVLAAFGTIGVSGLLFSGILRRDGDLSSSALLSAGVGGGLLITAVIGLAAAVLRIRPSPEGVVLTLLVMGALGLSLWRRPAGSDVSLDLAVAALAGWMLLVGLLRLSFASVITLPPHVDSVQHFSIVRDMLNPEEPPVSVNTVAGLTSQYYHLGFHGLAAWIMTLAGASSPASLLVLGQLIQAAAIGAVYFPVYAAVRDARAAMVAVALAGVGWSMPAYASNWAKYPAVLGLAVLATAVGVWILALRAEGARRLPLLVAAAILVGGATLIHTRMLILFAAFMLSIAVAHRLRSAVPDRQARVRKLLPVAMALLGAATLMLVSTPSSLDPIRRSLATFIEAQGGLSTVVVLLLAPFALRRHRTAALASMTWMTLILLCEFLPPNAAYPLPIVDPPLARMAFFLPLCSLGGLGVSGVDSSLRSAALRQPVAKLLRVGVAFGLLAYLGRSFAEQSYAPSECCVLARQDDVTMARLASDQLPYDALVLIASQASVDPNAGPFPVDGGKWMSALTPIRTIMMPAGTDLAAASQHALLCGQRITHVYVGGAPGGFSRVMLDSAPDLYTRQLSLPGAAIYSVIGCGGPDTRTLGLRLPFTLHGSVPGLGQQVRTGVPLEVPNGAPAG